MDSTFSIAIHALTYLNHKNCSLTSEELAENICTNPARVRKVMSALGKAGLIESKAGHVGGYCFTGEADKLTLESVATAMETHFVSAAWRSGDMDMDCLVASGMSDIMDGIYLQLDTLCREKLRNITIGDIDRRIFADGDEPCIEKK